MNFRFLLVLLTAVSTFQISAQNRLLYLLYENTQGETGITTFDYEKGTNIRISLWQLIDGTRNSINYHYYDSLNQQIKKYREFSDGITSEQNYTYDTYGNLVSETFSRSDGRKGFTEYVYENGKLVKADCKGYNGWIYGVISYSYSGKNKTSAVIRDGDKTTGEISYSYDENGNLVKEHWIFEGGFTQTFEFVYESVDQQEPVIFGSSNPFLSVNNNCPLIKEFYNYSNESKGVSDFTYDNHNKLLEKVYNRSDGFSTKTYFLYNNNGLLTKSYRKYSDGKSGIFTFTYDSSDRVIEKDFLRTDGMSSLEKYYYNPDGRLSSAEYTNMDGWLTGRLSFNHDDVGRITSGIFKSENDLDAKITFKHEECTNPVEIRWDFNTGKFQIYRFEYDRK